TCIHLSLHCVFFFQSSRDHRDLHSFPTRRSSDLSLGRDAATISLNQVPGTVARCALGTDREQQANCVIGAVLDFVCYYHSDGQAKQLCAAVDAALQDVCRSTTAKVVGLFLVVGGGVSGCPPNPLSTGAVSFKRVLGGVRFETL